MIISLGFIPPHVGCLSEEEFCGMAIAEISRQIGMGIYLDEF